MSGPPKNRPRQAAAPADRYLAFMGLWPARIPHWEHWSCPDAETYLTGIDYYEHPRLCRLRLMELYPMLELPIPASDEPKPRPSLEAAAQGCEVDAQGVRRVRWGDGVSNRWDWGSRFSSVEDVFAFSPLSQGDFVA